MLQTVPVATPYLRGRRRSEAEVRMCCSHLCNRLAAMAIVLSMAGCGADTTSPAARQAGPTAPQGPRATPPNSAPLARSGADLVAECLSHEGATITLDGSTSADSDGRIVLYEWFEQGKLIATGATPTVTLGTGTHQILMQVTDNQGGTNDDVVAVTIQDTNAPAIQMTVEPSALWPPNHTMRLVSSSISITDVCDPAPALGVTVTSDEAENGLGDGDTAPDWLVERIPSGAFDVWVRAERSGLGNGRVYGVRATGADRSGNSAVRSGTVTVPHNQ